MKPYTPDQMRPLNMPYSYDEAALSLGTRTFADNLANLMEWEAVQKTELCRRAGISRSQLSRFLGGKSYPKPSVLVKICELFGVDARILTNRISPGPEHPPQGDVYSAIWEALVGRGAFSPNQDLQKFIPLHDSDVEDGLYQLWYPLRRDREHLRVRLCNSVPSVTLSFLTHGTSREIGNSFRNPQAGRAVMSEFVSSRVRDFAYFISLAALN